LIGVDVLAQPAPRDLSGQAALAIGGKAADGEPLYRRPAVGAIPLLPGPYRRRAEAPRLQQAAPQARGDGMSLGLRRDAEIKRKHGSHRDGIGRLLFLP